MIPSNFTIGVKCTASYNTFFEVHKEDTNPICFRVAIFCKYLAYLCQDHMVHCNVNEFNSLRLEFHIWPKIEY